MDASWVFLGTASMRPSASRNVTGNALRIGGEWAIIDCGEGTQHQIMKSSVSPGSVNRIFITHLHGDHCFGLPGLLCLMGTSNEDAEAERVVQIVGPRGLRNMLRSSLLASATFTTFRFRVDELVTGPLPEVGAHGLQHFSSVFTLPLHPCELEGLDVLPLEGEASTLWEVPRHPIGEMSPMNGAWRVFAAPLRHTVQSLGFVFREQPHRGTMNVNALRPRLTTEENKTFQRETRGLKNPLQLLGQLQKGSVVEIMEQGQVVKIQPMDVLGPPRPGRVIAVLGDTSDSRALASIAFDADFMVHEATNAALDGEDAEEVLCRTVSHGHSTPEMAGAFGACCRARQLALTHFSSRYKGDDSEESQNVMQTIVAQAQQALGHDDVFAARDLMEVPLRVSKQQNQTVKGANGTSIASSLMHSRTEASKRATEAAESFLVRVERFQRLEQQQLPLQEPSTDAAIPSDGK